MEGCLLCLELNKAVCVTGNSTQWQELDIKTIIEKHFWVMQIIQPSSWLCMTCWQELYDFHKFYVRIEEAHMNFGAIIKSENEVKLPEPIDKLEEDKQEIEDRLFESQLEPEISLHGSLPTELIIEEDNSIKQEENQKNPKDTDDDDDEDDMPLIQTRKRKCRDKDLTDLGENIKNVIEEDPLNKTRKSKRIKKKEPKTKKLKKVGKKSNNSLEKPINDLKTTATETTETVPEPTTLNKPEERHNSLDSANENNTDIDSEFELDNDREFSDNNETTRSTKNPAISDEKDIFIAENFKVTCILCNIPMENFHLMRKHFKMEHKHIKKGYVMCCNKKIFSRCALFDHVNHHLDPNYFKCQKCDKVFKDRLCLTGHLKRHNGDMEKKFSCDVCDKSFSIPSLLKYHKMTHLPEEEKPFPCSECGKRFGNELSLTNHVRAVHLNKYAKICEVCGKSLSSADVFERHMLEHEGKPAPVISCDICGLLLTSKKGLKRHKNTIHPVGGHQEYTCSICSKVSSNRQAHDRHVKFSHEMGCNHKCTMCEKAFKKPRALKEHMATHTGDILYTCEWCTKTFNSSANFHSHRKKIHPVEWEEANRKKYAGNLPPSLKAPTINTAIDIPISFYMNISKNCEADDQK